jgi:hypothetical protein
MQCFLYGKIYVQLSKIINGMSIINVNKLVNMMGDRNHYTYMRVTNMLKGLKGNSSKKDIQQVRKLIQREFSTIDTLLGDLENQPSSNHKNTTK